MTLTLREITPANLESVLALRTTPEQERFVSSVADSMQEAADCPEGNPWYRAVYADERPVGFVMMSWDVEPRPPDINGPWFLWKLLIDHRHQHQGHGREVVRQLVDLVRAHGGTELLTSHGQGEGGPAGFYARLGFTPRGDVDPDGEIILRLDLGLDVPRVLGELTLEEKVSLLDGEDFWRTTAIERLGVPSVLVSDGPHGLRTQQEGGDHLGLTGSEPATCFPPASAIASSWDTDLVHRVGEALGRESRALGVSVLLGPGINMKRSPLCGRNFEYLSEDPHLAGELATALVRGVQSQGVGTSLKHFAANNQETDRMTVSADVDERTLREIYLPAFERVVTGARPWTVMCSYNRINGVYASEDPWLLTTVLREEWGFDGLVVSDWGAVNRRDAAVAAGLDLEMPSSSGGGTRTVLDAVRSGTLAEAKVNDATARVLTLAERALRGLTVPVDPVDVDAHHALARDAATASAVLLKNDGGLLPLDPQGTGSVAVIGEMARTPRYQGAGSSQVNPTRLDSALDALTTSLGGRRDVVFAAGYVVEADAGDPALVHDAVAAASAADVALVFLGLPPSWESEGYDRSTMDLPAAQVELLEAVAAVNPRVVVILSNGGAVTVSPWQHHARAVLEGWLLGQAGGSATVDLLLGVTSPSGRLAETLPVRYEDNPTIGAFPGEHGHVRYGEGLLIGYRWYDAHALPVAYPFGHGLSYTTFAYTGLTVDVVDPAGPRAEIRLTVTNTGGRAGTETVQAYVADRHASVYRPEQELKGFTRVTLDAGESAEVSLVLDRRAFAFWHTALGRWVVESGTFDVRVGASSRDIRLSAAVDLEGDDLTPPLTPDSTAELWFAHPEGGPWLHRAMGDSDFARLMADPRNGEMLRAVPLVRLTRMPGFPVTEEEVGLAVGRLQPPPS